MLVEDRGVSRVGDDIVGREGFAWVVDLEVPESEIVERMKLLGVATLDVRVAHVGVLRAVYHRDLSGDTVKR